MIPSVHWIRLGVDRTAGPEVSEKSKNFASAGNWTEIPGTFIQSPSQYTV